MLWLKALISFVLEPLTLVLLTGAVGVALTLVGRWRRAGRLLTALALLLLFAAGNRWVSYRLVGALESRYPPVGECPADGTPPPQLAACRYVVVLGSGHEDSASVAALDKLSDPARARLTEGLRILRRLPAATLVVSGGPLAAGGPAHAEVLAEAAVSLGVDRVRIRLLNDTHTTEDEAAQLGPVVGDAPIALVTSALHMPRAVALCTAAGLHVTPCPADHLCPPQFHGHWFDIFWNAESLERTTVALHEYIGRLWSALRGRT